MEYKTPGVYVEEVSTLPPSVAGVATAIPAFIGYTQQGPTTPTRITSMLEYETIFGGADPSTYSVVTSTNDGLTSIDSITATGDTPSTGVPNFMMYYQLQMFFKNGGSACYIISLGGYSSTPTGPAFSDGLALLAKEDEPTLILMPDAIKLDDASYHGVCVEALQQCATLGDRFCIFDVKSLDESADAEGTNFRNGIGTNDLKYGAAYAPYLRTSIPVKYNPEDVEVDVAVNTISLSVDGLLVSYNGNIADNPTIIIRQATDPSLTVSTQRTEDNSRISVVINGTGQDAAVADILALWEDVADKANFSLEAVGDSPANVVTTFDSPGQALTEAAAASPNMALIENAETSLFNQIKLALGKQYVTLPPSGAVAGMYAKVDRERGVWKAPANVSLASVTGPSIKYTHAEQENLNVDPTAGKSINAIRSFAGKGTLIWGARTLAGNDNEWRYINVRRLFNMIEESVQKATAFAVFEPNVATTWLKVKGMIDSYLYGLWQQGALAGPTPEAAYFINVGLGKTMTTQDILEGRMIVEIGIAAVRPAEFIILRFSHKLQEA